RNGRVRIRLGLPNNTARSKPGNATQTSSHSKTVPRINCVNTEPADHLRPKDPLTGGQKGRNRVNPGSIPRNYTALRPPFRLLGGVTRPQALNGIPSISDLVDNRGNILVVNVGDLFANGIPCVSPPVLEITELIGDLVGSPTNFFL